MEKVQDVVQRYLENAGVSLRKFAEALTESVRFDGLSHNAVMLWRDGISEPDTDFLCLMLLAYKDWRFDFALECLAAKRPEIWGVPEGEIWSIACEIEERIGRDHE